MKRIFCLLWSVIFLFGCSQDPSGLKEAMEFRERLLKGGCRFQTEVTADFGDTVNTFRMDCAVQIQGDLTFTVTEPELIRGIGGRVTGSQGTLIFSDTVLAFPLLAQGELSPVSAPWLLVNALRSGSMSCVGKDDALTRLSLADTFLGEGLRVEVWFDGQWLPVEAELYWNGRRAVSMKIMDFVFV